MSRVIVNSLSRGILVQLTGGGQNSVNTIPVAIPISDGKGDTAPAVCALILVQNSVYFLLLMNCHSKRFFWGSVPDIMHVHYHLIINFVGSIRKREWG